MQGSKFEAVERGVIACQDDYGVWSTSRPDLEAALSLLRVGVTSRMNGLPSNRPPLLQYRPIDQILPSEALLATHWYRRPYLYLYLVFCEGLDGYRLLVKQKIKSWVDSMIERQLEWLVIYVPIGANTRIGTTARSEAEKNFQKVLQKIRSDTPSKLGNHNRVCYLKINDDRPISERYEEVIGPMQECLALAFEQRRLQYEEEIRKLEMNRAYAGWNYFTFFATKEGLAFIFEQFTLFDEALREYNELQQIYETITQRGKLFDTACAPETGDDSIPIIKNDKKDFRSRIISSQITKFDFLRYLFAQKAWLLNSLGRQSDLLLMGMKFWRSINTDMLIFEDDVTKAFFCSWGYHFCVELAKLTESVIEMPSPAKTELQIAMGTLYQDAKTKLGKIYKLMSTNPDLGSYKITHETILKVISSEKSYYQTYSDITQSSHNFFQMAGRYRTSARLLFEVADCEMHLKDYEGAESKLKSMCGYYFSGKWDDLIYYSRDKLATCQKELGHITEYTSSCLELLSAEVPCVRDKKKHYIKELATMGSTVLAQVVARSMNPIFFVTCHSPKGKEFPMGEDIHIECKLKSSLPDNFTFDRACLRYVVTGNPLLTASKKKKTILFVTKNVTAKANSTTIVNFTGKFPAQGVYFAERIWLQKGKVILTYNFSSMEQTNLTIKMRPGLTTASLKIYKPEGLILGQQEFIKVVVTTDEDQLRNIVLNFSSHTSLSIGSGGSQDLQLIPRNRKFLTSLKSIDPDEELAESNIMNDSDDEMEHEQGSNVITMEAEKDSPVVSSVSTVQLHSEHNTSNDSNTTMGDELPIHDKELHDDSTPLDYELPPIYVTEDAYQSILDSVDLGRTTEISLEESPETNEDQIAPIADSTEAIAEESRNQDSEKVEGPCDTESSPEQRECENINALADLSDNAAPKGFIPEQENMINYHRMVDVLDQQSENSSVVDPSDSYADSFMYESTGIMNDSSPPSSITVTNSTAGGMGSGGSYGSSSGTPGPIISVSYDNTSGEVSRSLKSLSQTDMKISQCASNTIIELQLPVCCKEIADKEHNFSVELCYSNQSGDIFSLSDNANLHFRAPFDVSTYVDYKPPFTFIRFVLTSRLPVPIKIESHSYTLPKTISHLFQNIHDTNSFSVMTVLPRDRISFMYILERSSASEQVTPKLSLGLHLNIISEEKDPGIPLAKHTFTHSINFSDVQTIAYEVYVRYPPHIPENEIMEVEYVIVAPAREAEQAAGQAKSIRRLKKEGFVLQDQYFLPHKERTPTGVLFYQVTPAVQYWQVCGKIRGEIKGCGSLPASQEILHRVPLMVVALSAGRVSLPTIQLVSSNRGALSEVVHQPHRRFVEVLPPTRVIIPLGERYAESPNPLRTR